jgi:hypothetical protein
MTPEDILIFALMTVKKRFQAHGNIARTLAARAAYMRSLNI